MTIRKACELYDEPRYWLFPQGKCRDLWPWHQLQNLHSIRKGRDERRNDCELLAGTDLIHIKTMSGIGRSQTSGYTNTREPMQSSRRARPRSRETQGLAEEERRIESGKAFGSGSSRCGQAPKGVGGMPWRHQKSERGRLRNAWGSCRTSVDPGILTKTQGTETSQYLVEKKSTETPSVVASERG